MQKRLTPSMLKRGRFTLIELMIVIAIIAMLASMLLPGLAYARTKARNIACVYNQRQIVMSEHMYAGDWDDYLPGGPVAPVDADTVREKLDLEDLFAEADAWEAEGYADGVPPATYQEVMRPYVGDKKIFQCPGDDGYLYGRLSWSSYDVSDRPRKNTERNLGHHNKRMGCLGHSRYCTASGKGMRMGSSSGPSVLVWIPKFHGMVHTYATWEGTVETVDMPCWEGGRHIEITTTGGVYLEGYEDSRVITD